MLFILRETFTRFVFGFCTLLCLIMSKLHFYCNRVRSKDIQVLLALEDFAMRIGVRFKLEEKKTCKIQCFFKIGSFKLNMCYENQVSASQYNQ